MEQRSLERSLNELDDMLEEFLRQVEKLPDEEEREKNLHKYNQLRQRHEQAKKKLELMKTYINELEKKLDELDLF